MDKYVHDTDNNLLDFWVHVCNHIHERYIYKSLVRTLKIFYFYRRSKLLIEELFV